MGSIRFWFSSLKGWDRVRPRGPPRAASLRSLPWAKFSQAVGLKTKPGAVGVRGLTPTYKTPERLVAYWFAGYFATPAVPIPTDLPTGAVWRPIAVPFNGCGVRLPHLFGKSPDPDAVRTQAHQLGLDTGDWLYLTCTCWAGSIDHVYGLGSRAGVPFGPTETDARDEVEPAYLGLMAAFGVAEVDARWFPPFVRGFWGERGREL